MGKADWYKPDLSLGTTRRRLGSITSRFRRFSSGTGRFQKGKIAQEELQLKTFTRWWEATLEYSVSDLCTELQSASLAYALLEKLEGGLPIYSRRSSDSDDTPRSKFEALENWNRMLEWLTQRGIKLVNISAEGLKEGRRPQVLGLSWALIRWYELGDRDGVQELAKTVGTWVSQGAAEHVAHYSDRLISGRLTVNDFADGVALCALLHKHRPEALHDGATGPEAERRYQALGTLSASDRLAHVFEAAQSLGVPKLIDSMDLAAGHVDDRSLLIYLSRVHVAVDKAAAAEKAERDRRAAEQAAAERKAREEAERKATEDAKAKAEVARSAKASISAESSPATPHAQIVATKRAQVDAALEAVITAKARVEAATEMGEAQAAGAQLEAAAKLLAAAKAAVAGTGPLAKPQAGGESVGQVAVDADGVAVEIAVEIGSSSVANETGDATAPGRVQAALPAGPVNTGRVDAGATAAEAQRPVEAAVANEQNPSASTTASPNLGGGTVYGSRLEHGDGAEGSRSTTPNEPPAPDVQRAQAKKGQAEVQKGQASVKEEDRGAPAHPDAAGSAGSHSTGSADHARPSTAQPSLMRSLSDTIGSVLVRWTSREMEHSQPGPGSEVQSAPDQLQSAPKQLQPSPKQVQPSP